MRSPFLIWVSHHAQRLNTSPTVTNFGMNVMRQSTIAHKKVADMRTSEVGQTVALLNEEF